MIKTFSSQKKTDCYFRIWVDALLGAGRQIARGWILDGDGIVFTNYGDGTAGTIHDQVMLGTDPAFRTNVVKIVRPNVTQGAKGRQTLIGSDRDRRPVLLREGCLQDNKLSRRIKADFDVLSGLTPEPVSAKGEISDRDWYIVAYLDEPAAKIVRQTIAFARACHKARMEAGGGDPKLTETKGYGWAMDEEGGVHLTTRPGGTVEVRRFHNYVSAALKSKLGKRIGKPTDGRFTADGLVKTKKLLIEIKTATFAHTIYEAVGQLRLYPELLGLGKVTPILLLPGEPKLSAALAAALAAQGIDVATYSIDKKPKKPEISFDPSFLARCRMD